MSIETIFPAVFIWILFNMVSSCAAFVCANRVKKASGISFDGFPKKGSELEKQWIRAVRRKNWSPSKTSCLCSDHFDRSCFIEGKTNRRLHKNAVPSVFPQFTKHLQKSDLKRKSSKKCKLTEPFTVTCDLLPSKIVRAVSFDHPYHSVADMDKTVDRLKKQVKALREKLHRREKHIHNLKDLLSSLKEKQLIADEQLQNLKQNFGGAA